MYVTVDMYNEQNPECECNINARFKQMQIL